MTNGKTPRRVLVVTSDFAGGTGVHLGRLLASLDSSAWRCHVVSLGVRHIEPLPPTTVEDVSLGAWRRFPLAQARQFAAVQRALTAFKPQVIHSFFFWSHMYGRILKRVHPGPAVIENREDLGFNLDGLDKRLLRATSGAPDRVVAVSDAVARAALHVEPSLGSRLSVIRNGVPIPDGTPRADQRNAQREALGATADSLVVGLVSMLNRPVKGVRYFLAALPAIVAAVPNVRFAIFGDGADRADHEAQVRALGMQQHVVFAGRQSDMTVWYPALDLSVLTSLSEGLSITILESMSHGIPVVVTRVGGNPELVLEGQTGDMVPPQDPAAFADAVIALLRDPERRKRYGIAARDRAQSEFGMDKVAHRYMALWDALSPGGSA